MWDSRIDFLNDGRIQRYALLRDDVPLAYAEVLSLWRDDASFRSYFFALLSDSPFEAYRWETPCVTLATLTRQFEFVLLRSDGLARTVDTSAFAKYFNTASEVVTFPNLGRDAVMVVPCPICDTSIYGHLASFMRHAPKAQLHHLWTAVAVAMEQRVCARPVWLSTAGMGVSWLHVRLDDRPKYYGYAAYRKIETTDHC
jgi:hypothetical protein